MTTDGLKTIQDYKDAAAALKAAQPNTLGVAFAVAGGDAGNDAADALNSGYVAETRAVENDLLREIRERMTGAEIDVGRMARASGGTVRLRVESAEKKEREFKNLLIQQQLEDSRRRYEDIMNRIRAEQKQIEDDLSDLKNAQSGNRQRFNDNNQFIDEASDVIEDFDRTGKIDRTKAIKLLEKRGVEVPDNMTDGQLAAMLSDCVRTAHAENDVLDHEYVANDRRIRAQQDRWDVLQQEAEDVTRKHENGEIITEENVQEIKKRLEQGQLSSAAVYEVAQGSNHEVQDELVQSIKRDDLLSSASLSSDEDIFGDFVEAALSTEFNSAASGETKPEEPKSETTIAAAPQAQNVPGMTA